MLLVIFMVTTPLIVQGRIQVKLPRSTAQADAQASTPLTITLTWRPGAEFLGDQQVSQQDLPALLGAALKARDDKTVVIRADRSVTHGQVVELMDLSRRCGAEKLAIATEAQP